MAVKFLVLVSIQMISLAASAATPESVCNTIRAMNKLPLTQQNARSCDTLVSRGTFHPAAVDVCLEMVSEAKDLFVQEEAVTCLRTIRNKTFSDVPGKCLRIVQENLFSSTRTRAVNCLVEASAEGKADAPQAIQAPAAAPSLAPLSSHVASGIICPKDKDCWSDALTKLRDTYGCDVRKNARTLPPGHARAGDTSFGFISLNCELKSADPSDHDDCSPGTTARGVGNGIKVCVPSSGSTGRTSSALTAR